MSIKVIKRDKPLKREGNLMYYDICLYEGIKKVPTWDGLGSCKNMLQP